MKIRNLDRWFMATWLGVPLLFAAAFLGCLAILYFGGFVFPVETGYRLPSMGETARAKDAGIQRGLEAYWLNR